LLKTLCIKQNIETI